MRLGDAIRAQRLRLSMSQEALADTAGINRTHMGEVERGKRNISFLGIAKIATAMDMKPSEILASAGL
jgi:transcriptional regulator with XRE-family HTH domain